MSDLFRSAISSRLAKLPPDVPIYTDDGDEDEEAEAADSIGELPGSGMGPPAMQVSNLFDSLQH
jgi:protein phosphatase methylesterase 1